jgi:hypothetical protein
VNAQRKLIAYLLISLHEIEKLMSLNELAGKTRIFQAILKDQSLSYFEHNLKRRLKAED